MTSSYYSVGHHNHATKAWKERMRFRCHSINETEYKLDPPSIDLSLQLWIATSKKCIKQVATSLSLFYQRQILPHFSPPLQTAVVMWGVVHFMLGCSGAHILRGARGHLKFEWAWDHRTLAGRGTRGKDGGTEGTQAWSGESSFPFSQTWTDSTEKNILIHLKESEPVPITFLVS